MPSTVTVQSVVNYATANVELMPLAGVGGFSNEPALSLANDTLRDILGEPYAWKFNRNTMGLFVPQMNVQDTKFAGAAAFVLSSSGNLGGVGIVLKSASGITTSGYPGTVTVNTYDNHNFNVGDTVYLVGVADSVYNSTSSVTPSLSQWTGGYVITAVPTSTSFQFASISGQTMTSGAPGITDFGWAESATMVNEQEDSSPRKVYFLEAAKRLQPTSYIAVPQKFQVTDNQDSTLTIRMHGVPGAAPWGVTIVYQKKAPLLADLTGTWTPIPDEYAHIPRGVFLQKAYAYMRGAAYGPQAEQEIMRLIAGALAREDAEQDEMYMVPEQPLMGWDYGF